MLLNRLGDADLRVLPPLGFHPKLPDVAAQGVNAALANRAWKQGESHLLLAAHGSAKGSKAAESAYAFQSALSKRFDALEISVGFVEEPPFMADAARALPKQSLCLPFFALGGDHCRHDIPEAFEKAMFSGDTMPPLGTWPEIAKLAAEAIQNAR